MVADDEAGLGLRERKKRETRQALSLAAIRLGVERGWDDVTVQDIAAAANVSVRTFRNYFTGKAEAIAARHLDRMVLIADELRARPAAEPLWEAIAAAVLAHFAPEPDGGSEPDPGRTAALRLMLTEPAVQGAVLRADVTAQAELATAIAERTGTDVRRDVYPRLVAAMVCAASGTAVQHCLRTDPPLSLGPVLRDVLDQLRAGLPVP